MYTVLAVDDEVDNLEMVEYALKDEFEVIPVKSGEMALKYLMGNTLPFHSMIMTNVDSDKHQELKYIQLMYLKEFYNSLL